MYGRPVRGGSGEGRRPRDEGDQEAGAGDRVTGRDGPARPWCRRSVGELLGNGGGVVWGSW